MNTTKIRLWPGVVLVALQWLAVLLRIAAPVVGSYALLGVVVCGLGIVLWWLFFSRAPWAERIGVLAVVVAALVATKAIVHPSIANGAMGNLIYVLSIPFWCLALVASAAATRHLSPGARRASMAAAIVVACLGFTLVRTGGMSGGGDMDLHWRWTPTPEERLLAQEPHTPVAPPATAAAAPASAAPAAPAASAPAASATPGAPATSAEATQGPVWPGFRGPARDGVIHGVKIETDWAKSPPVQLWRRPVGPGWSSFAVRGNFIYTQEQRGDDEVVSCYDLTTGQPVWRHADKARFYESNGGPGPRATPTLANGRVYTLGATGILNALDAGTGAVAWSRNAATDTGAENPGWGFAGSPLVVGDAVIVATSGRLAAYDAASGAPRWQGPAGGAGYSSPHLATIDGVDQVLLLRGARSTSVAPKDGTLLWEHRADPGVSIVQPAFSADGDVLVAVGGSMGAAGLRRLDVSHGPGGWTVAERWMSSGLKPYFNDFVVHEGHAFGFDGSILASIDLADGARKWKGGRYGSGQLVLLADQDLLLVVSEEGELALVKATPDQFTEVARVPAIEGKTWNHPVLVGNVLLVRNGEQMAAFRLPLAGS
jgi:outer membrane protein assembly factor BamB